MITLATTARSVNRLIPLSGSRLGTRGRPGENPGLAGLPPRFHRRPYGNGSAGSGQPSVRGLFARVPEGRIRVGGPASSRRPPGREPQPYNGPGVCVNGPRRARVRYEEGAVPIQHRPLRYGPDASLRREAGAASGSEVRSGGPRDRTWRAVKTARAPDWRPPKRFAPCSASARKQMHHACHDDTRQTASAERPTTQVRPFRRSRRCPRSPGTSRG